MINENQAREVVGSTAYTSDGEKLGKVGHLFLDDQTSRPEFVSVNTGLFGTNETFIPIADATYDGERLTVPYSKDKVKRRPQRGRRRRSPRRVRGAAPVRVLRRGRRLVLATTTAPTRPPASPVSRGDDNAHGTEGHDTSGPTTDDAMTRSEEQLEVGTTRREAGRARLRKYVTTEQETVTVPVQKERAVLETEPITDANAATPPMVRPSPRRSTRSSSTRSRSPSPRPGSPSSGYAWARRP